jgi:uncharacterized FAD-dependent dehydrogenase
MSKIIKDVEVPLDTDILEHLKWLEPDLSDYRILKQSVDARKRHNVHFVYTVEVETNGKKIEYKKTELQSLAAPPAERPIVIGSGPAGLFAALRLVERGIPCVLFERGSEAEQRIKGINRFWRYGELDSRNNVCYGEGGAGLYSDGKLITRIKSPHIPYVLEKLVEFGAPAEILYLANPHVGSDRIRRVIPVMREYLKSKGCEIHYNTQVKELLLGQDRVLGVRTEHNQDFKSAHVILATGHSAEDMLVHLRDTGVHLERKSFAMGLRIEHEQSLINQIQYREAAAHPKLGSANYKLTYYEKDQDIGVYSFCMCPGGYVLSSGTELGQLVCNGMSNFKRNSPHANSAIVMSLDKDQVGKDLWSGMELRRELEAKAFQAVQEAGGTKQLPVQYVTDFLAGKVTREVGKTSSPSGTVTVNLAQMLPKFMYQKLKAGLLDFETKMKGYLSPNAYLFGVETRTSCPVRVTRDAETLQSLSHAGLYPCGEGAGYAGGITSAACDGIKVAEVIYAQLQK